MKKTNKNTTTSSSSSASASASIIINNSQINKSSSNFEEAKKNFLKIRKRKERQESVNSLNQDRKIIRSNSEERPSSSSSSLSIMINCEDDSSHIRRVSSSGDFPKTAAPQQQQEEKSSSANKPVLLLKYDDYEHEKMRSNERHTFKSRKSNRKFKLRGTMKVNNNNNNNNNKEKQQSSSSSSTSEMIMENSSSSAAAAAHQDLPDFSTLYRANEEPVLSLPVCDDQPTIMTNKIPISPRNSIIAMERIYLERNLPQVVIKNPLDERLRKLTKQINSFKKKILLYENDFELQTGTKPTQMEKMNDFPLRKLYVELSRLKREKQQLEEISSNNSNKIILNTHHYHHYNNKEVIGLERTIEEIEERLQLKREHATRDIQSLNSNQLIEQKVATQKALLYLESVHGRPQNKEDRDLVRPFYDRYRQLKQMVSKLNNVNSSIELATIDENEAMQHFIPSASSSNETESYSSEQTEKPTSSSFISAEDDHDDIMMVSWHSLNKQELLIKLKEINAERNELKKKIKDFENGIIKIAKNKLTKDDKKPMEDIYISYKKVKKRLKLIQVLVGKFRT